MRNKFPGTCYFCHLRVERGQGHFERHGRAWRLIHAPCALQQRAEKQGKPDA